MISDYAKKHLLGEIDINDSDITLYIPLLFTPKLGVMLSFEVKSDSELVERLVEQKLTNEEIMAGRYFLLEGEKILDKEDMKALDINRDLAVLNVRLDAMAKEISREAMVSMQPMPFSRVLSRIRLEEDIAIWQGHKFFVLLFTSGLSDGDVVYIPVSKSLADLSSQMIKTAKGIGGENMVRFLGNDYRISKKEVFKEELFDMKERIIRAADKISIYAKEA